MTIDTDKLSLAGKQLKNQPLPARKVPIQRKQLIKGYFLKGPVPLAWLSKAARLPGKTSEVAIVIWFLSGMKKTSIIALSNKILNRFGVDRFAKYRALKQLQKESLILIEQDKGRSPLITILDVNTDEL